MPISEFTGDEVECGSEEWRHECEVRWLLDGCDLETRRRIVNGTIEYDRTNHPIVTKKGIRQHRGDAAADRIIADIRRLHAVREGRARAQTQSQPAADAAPNQENL